MGKLPRVNAREVAARLTHLGFWFVRQNGSHRTYRNAEGKRVTVPFHNAKILHPKIIKIIMRDADIVEW